MKMIIHQQKHFKFSAIVFIVGSCMFIYEHVEDAEANTRVWKSVFIMMRTYVRLNL